MKWNVERLRKRHPSMSAKRIRTCLTSKIINLRLDNTSSSSSFARGTFGLMDDGRGSSTGKGNKSSNRSFQHHGMETPKENFGNKTGDFGSSELQLQGAHAIFVAARVFDVMTWLYPPRTCFARLYIREHTQFSCPVKETAIA